MAKYSDLYIDDEKEILKVKRIERLSKGENPLVSVIIPVYNAENYLKTLLHSLNEQTYKNLEIICVNDGSTDNSLSVLQRIKQVDDRIKIINQENAGPAAARNAGLRAATGKYISFLDADDDIAWEMYEYLVDTAEDKNADIVIFGGYPAPDNDTTPNWIRDKLSPQKRTFDGDNAGVTALFYCNSSRPFLWLHFIKRSLIEQDPALRINENLDLGEDQLFQFMYFPRANNVVVIDEKLYVYNWNHEGSLMWKYNNRRTEKFEKHLLIVENVYEYWDKEQYKDPFGSLISWAVNFLYDDLIKFPPYIRCNYAKRIMAIFEKYNQQVFMCNEYEIKKGEKIEKLAQKEISFDENFELDIISMKNDIKLAEDTIQKALHSKRFRIGRMFVKRKDRLDIQSVLPAKVKKN